MLFIMVIALLANGVDVSVVDDVDVVVVVDDAEV